MKGGEQLVVSWTAASDSDGNLSGYILERAINGGSSYTQVFKGNALSFTDSITKGWTSIRYRVKAYDSYEAESGYTTSPERTVGQQHGSDHHPATMRTGQTSEPRAAGSLCPTR